MCLQEAVQRVAERRNIDICSQCIQQLDILQKHVEADDDLSKIEWARELGIDHANSAANTEPEMRALPAIDYRAA